MRMTRVQHPPAKSRRGDDNDKAGKEESLGSNAKSNASDVVRGIIRDFYIPCVAH